MNEMIQSRLAERKLNRLIEQAEAVFDLALQVATGKALVLVSASQEATRDAALVAFE